MGSPDARQLAGRVRRPGRRRAVRRAGRRRLAGSPAAAGGDGDAPERGRPYGQPYREGHGDGYGADPYGRDPYGQGADGLDDDPYARRGEFQAAVDALDDPLSDPLPGQGSRRPPPPATRHRGTPGTASPLRGSSRRGTRGRHQGRDSRSRSRRTSTRRSNRTASPWFRPHREPGATTQSSYVAPPAAPQRPQHPQHPRRQGYTGQAPYARLRRLGAAPQRRSPAVPAPAAASALPATAACPRPRQPGPDGAPEPAGPPRPGVRTDGCASRGSRRRRPLPVVDSPTPQAAAASTGGAMGQSTRYKSTQTVGLVRRRVGRS